MHIIRTWNIRDINIIFLEIPEFQRFITESFQYVNGFYCLSFFRQIPEISLCIQIIGVNGLVVIRDNQDIISVDIQEIQLGFSKSSR